MTSGINKLPGAEMRYALVIGIDEYDDPQIHGLNGAGKDAKTIADALIHYAGFLKDQVILLTSDQPRERRPTRGNILRYVSNLLGSVPKDGLFLISFAGHGIEREGEAFILPSDAVNGGTALLEDTAIPARRVIDSIGRSGIRQVLVFLDACRSDPEQGRGLEDQKLTEAYMRGFDFYSRNSNVEAFAVLYATGKGQTAYEYKEKSQGYFSWALVEGLKGEAANQEGEVTRAGLISYVERTVPKQIGIDLGIGKEQIPYSNVQGYQANQLVIALTPNKKKLAPGLHPWTQTQRS